MKEVGSLKAQGRENFIVMGTKLGRTGRWMGPTSESQEARSSHSRLAGRTRTRGGGGAGA